MPPKWPRKPDRTTDPAYRKLEDRINFAVHFAFFAACNSIIWFVHNLKQADWSWIGWLTGVWVIVLVVHFIYIAVIADYSWERPRNG
ncbi:MAG: 2TM domain-containing protein [Cyanobacteria bacterium P01_H01_bin.15]